MFVTKFVSTNRSNYYYYYYYYYYYTGKCKENLVGNGEYFEG
jgi:hypothetical protein